MEKSEICDIIKSLQDRIEDVSSSLEDIMDEVRIIRRELNSLPFEPSDIKDDEE